MMIWYKSCDREELLHILGGGAADVSIIRSESDADLAGRECALLWRTAPGRNPGPPQVIVVRRVSDFIAWASTYLSHYRPVTAFFRIVQEKDLPRFATASNDIGTGDFANVFVGAIVAEAYLRSAKRAESWRPSVNMLLSTCSFALARTFALQSGLAYEEVIGRWHHASRWVEHREVEDIRRSIEIVWSSIGSLIGVVSSERAHPVVLEACRQLMRDGQVVPRTWTQLVGASSNVSVASEIMSLSRERRLEWLDSVVSRLTPADTLHPGTMPFVVGYLFSQLAPGSMDHIGLLASLAISVPEAVLWYGVCAGLYARSDVQNYGNGVTRRALRDVESWEAFVDRPRCDVGVDEVESLLPIYGAGVTLRPFVVEVAPRVYSTFGVVPQRPHAFPEPIDRSRLAELGRLLNSAADLYYDIVQPAEQRQLDLRRSRPTRKGVPKNR
jgi:hypothetical protein